MKSQLAEDIEDMKLEMTKPAVITDFKLAPTDPRQLAWTAYNLNFKSKMPYPEDSYVIIDFHPDQIGPRPNEKGKEVRCFSNLQFENVKCTFLKTSKGDTRLKVEGMIV